MNEKSLEEIDSSNWSRSKTMMVGNKSRVSSPWMVVPTSALEGDANKRNNVTPRIFSSIAEADGNVGKLCCLDRLNMLLPPLGWLPSLSFIVVNVQMKRSNGQEKPCLLHHFVREWVPCRITYKMWNGLMRRETWTILWVYSGKMLSRFRRPPNHMTQ